MPIHASRPLIRAAAVLGALLVAMPASGETPEEKGTAIAEEADRRDQGYGDTKTVLRMVLANSQGETSTRALRLDTLEFSAPGDGDKSMIIFDEPRDVQGTALLTHTKILDPDEQWLWLPALSRIKRISSANKSGPFVGSEFAYEDLIPFEIDKFDFRWLRDEPCGELQCFVMERFPLYENSGYTYQVAWVDQEEYRLMKVDFYDRKESLLKTLTFSGYQQYLEQFWRADELAMVNHQTGKSTVLQFEEYQFQTGLGDRDFTTQALERAR